MSDTNVTWKDLAKGVIALIVLFILVMFIAKQEQKVAQSSTDVVNVDSLLTTNDSIKIVIKYIDSTKNEEIEKVLKLDNDSTLELFKQLVRE